MKLFMPKDSKGLLEKTMRIKVWMTVDELVANIATESDETIMEAVDKLLENMHDADLYHRWAKEIHDDYERIKD